MTDKTVEIDVNRDTFFRRFIMKYCPKCRKHTAFLFKCDFKYDISCLNCGFTQQWVHKDDHSE